jgi:hypothetical protein
MNKTDCHDITEIFLKVALNTITLTFIYFPLFNIFTNFCMNLGDIKQQSKNKTNFENILNSKKDIAMKPDTPVVMAMGQ